ncbi:ISKra4 family transposase [Streptomyces sp. M2CJ-2]|uniref:ISKra4 family transposase n=1 Tax=Streptomyces sp. M2CJ-2 TaxID=2803948 RepID=UPI0019254EC2|nr:ISKra4 family transposase [Streptomyces sp. M2CJ-2]MBL3671674.1 ISKra4 family transposase [Streptomyces sp. M2CJ-2]
MERYDTHDVPDPFACSMEAVKSLAARLSAPETAALDHAAVEHLIEQDGREILRRFFQDHLDLRARHEEQHPPARMVLGTDHEPRPHRETGHERQLTCLFGKVIVTRCAWRSRGRPNVHPADATLWLPRGRHSHGIKRLAVREAVRGSYQQAVAAITDRCGKVLGKRRAESLVASAAVDIDAFYRHKIASPCTADMPLVIQVDGKGVVMRPEALREATRRAAEAKKRQGRQARLAPGEKPNRKRMATIACVHDTVPAPRRAHDIVHPPGGRSGLREARPGPRAVNRWCTASLVHDPDEVIAEAFTQADDRDPGHLRPWLVLVDGARHQLDLIETEARHRNVKIHILIDFVHVAEYVWAAAHALHPVGSVEAETFAAQTLTAILHGHAARVADEMTARAGDERLTDAKRGSVEACVRYLTGHLDQLRYDTALEKGWPIATGSVEGACRHLIGDRLDITGARWGLAGAEAVLKLRAVHANDDLEAYLAYHHTREHQRTYPDQHHYQLDA